MERQFELKIYGKVYPITLEIHSYLGGNLAIQMVSWEEGIPEPWSSLTVNLDGVREKDCAFIDVNDNGEAILAWIIRYGLAVPTGVRKNSGYCSYPEYRFKETVLREIDQEGYEAYLAYLKEGERKVVIG
uniref:DUF4313 domain-containing protein n=1 Tax=Enterocloster clostridioformis TaxID=1531 RepID=UPI00266F2242|nr:DUF4313 domain-containing protein [Enterocloster clostridioformis]